MPRQGSSIARCLAAAGLFAITWLAASPPAAASTLAPDPVVDGVVSLRITEAGTPTPPGDRYNFAAPVVIDGALHIVDQFGEILRARNDGGYDPVLTRADLPAGVSGGFDQTIMNIADGPGARVYVALSSATLPEGVTPLEILPDDGAYGGPGRERFYQILYRFTQQPDGRLTDPTALTAFEMARVSHTGGGMLALETGEIVYATGDSLRFDRDGLSAPQADGSDLGEQPGSHLGKLLVIDGESGATRVAARGLRNVQRLTFADTDQSRIAFADIGAQTAEEINSITVADLLDLGTIENFGWGRNADGNAREGTFYVSDGTTSVPGSEPAAIGRAPVPEAGFLQPYAQYGSETGGGVAISGPAIPLGGAFDGLMMLFGDLVTGAVYATLDAFGGTEPVPVYSVSLLDASGAPVTLHQLAGGRADPRFFTFADGGPGVFLEATGQLYRFSETVQPVPLPASVVFLLAAFGGLALLRRRSLS